jgi:5-methyltetrahydropteroyltriglutamate--homocysteine methyltransferase
MAKLHIAGYPRIGAQRELKFALETYWKDPTAQTKLDDTARALRQRAWERQEAAGLAFLAAGDFSYYDHVLDTAVLLGCLPARYRFEAARLTLPEYFALARGNAQHSAMEMTKWFDTNYHYLVPELDAGSRFDGGSAWFFDRVKEAIGRGRPVKPVLVGPLTFLRISKTAQPGFDRLKLIDALAAGYSRVVSRLKDMGVEWVQFDEPALATDLEPEWLAALERAYAAFAGKGPRILLATYFGSVARHLQCLIRLPVHGVHVDLVRDASQLEAWTAGLPEGWVLSVGVVDARNIWRTDLRAALAKLRPVQEKLGDRLWLAPSCSLLHVPVSVAGDEVIDAEVRPWLAFADEKLDELRVLGTALNQGEAAVRAELEAADRALVARRVSPRVADPAVRARMAEISADMVTRRSPFAKRIAVQRMHLDLPLLPTTAIGSFPQTAEIRAARAQWKKKVLSDAQYEAVMQAQIRHAVERQEALGLDVLVHGEAERNDMVEFFGEQLKGFTFSGNGWVQSYGSRCVKPPIIFGDVSRPRPMTVKEAKYAQSLTKKTMKGMVTGPVTILQWSFVRDDQPRSETATQIALAIRDEVADLEQAGIRVIQIDEPAIREGLPLRRADWQAYLDWAVRAFHVSASPVRDDTQIHTHMCYSEFNDILPSIAAMDADVITIETSRSRMELLDGFGAFKYPNEIGPGVYDIHAPRVPTVDDMVALLERAAQVIPVERLWVNPDCGLKTRGWPEVEAALANMVEAAKRLRRKLDPAKKAA